MHAVSSVEHLLLGPCLRQSVPQTTQRAHIRYRSSRCRLRAGLMSSATTLITFDVDGTLVRTVGKDSNR